MYVYTITFWFRTLGYKNQTLTPVDPGYSAFTGNNINRTLLGILLIIAD